MTRRRAWTKRAEAYGKGVWSWSADAGIKLEESSSDGGKKARFTEESAP